MVPADASPPRKTLLDRFLDGIERVGNKLPDPAVLFLVMIVLVWGISALLDGTSFTLPTKDGPLQKTVISQFTGERLVGFLADMVPTFTGFHPLGVVLVALMGVGVAEKAGFIDALLRRLIEVTPAKLLTPAIVFVATISHTASDAGYVLVIPLAGAIFHACGRHPLVGIAAAFAGVSGGFAANPLPSGTDPLLQGLTQAAVGILDPDRTVNPLCNWFFTASSSILVTLVGWFVTERIVEPRIGKTPLDGEAASAPAERSDSRADIRPLRIAALVALLGIVALALASYPEASPFRSAKTGALTGNDAPLMKAIVPLIALTFLAPGIAFGFVSGRFKSHRDVVSAMSKTLGGMGYYLVMAFCAAQFIKVFNDSQLGALLAVKGAELLRSMNTPTAVTLVAVVILTSIVNLFIGSASAKWALLAPILVPMLMQLGISPELTQATYRVGDSLTNIVTPLMIYFPLVVTYCQRWVKGTGVGTLTSIMIPYSFTLGIFWIAYLVIWWSLGLPLGIQGVLTYP